MNKNRVKRRIKLKRVNAQTLFLKIKIDGNIFKDLFLKNLNLDLETIIL
jgi:hypothetical protein